MLSPVAAYPYLGPAFEMTEKVPGSAPYLTRIRNFTYGAIASMGLSGSAISGLKYAVPRLVEGPFELALARCGEESRRMLEEHGWQTRDALSVSSDLDAYRAYISESRGEFTVAKDQNVRLRSGWFSDRSATYLAAGRPVITQETGFSEILPTGSGLFAFRSLDDILAAFETINADSVAQARGARALAREQFAFDVVLPRLLAPLGL